MVNEFYQRMQEAKVRKAEAKARGEENKTERIKINNERQRIRNQKQLKQLHKKSGKTFNKVAKVFSYNKQLSSNLMKEFTPGQNQNQRQGAGRPQGSLKHISPITGKPVFAQQYYKEMRFVRRQNEILTDKTNQVQNQQLARQGLSPQQIQQINMQRQMMQQNNQQMPQQPQQPVQQINQNQSVWNRSPGVVVQDAGLFGPRQIVTGRPESFWN